jgi:pimeloyl-ACP methyl ester carboxylesterase
MAEVVWGAIEALHIEKPILMGHSMGGMISQLVALSHQDELRALILVDTAAETLEVSHADIGEMMKAAETGGIEAVFEQRLKTAEPHVRANTQFVALWREQFIMTSIDAYVGGSLAMARRASIVEQLKSLKLPTLIVCGENDLPFLEPSRRIHAAIAGSQLEIIAGAGHSPTFETPEKFNAVLTAFLDKIEVTASA